MFYAADLRPDASANFCLYIFEIADLAILPPSNRIDNFDCISPIWKAFLVSILNMILLNSHKHLWMVEGGFGVNHAPSMPPKKVREL